MSFLIWFVVLSLFPFPMLALPSLAGVPDRARR